MYSTYRRKHHDLGPLTYTRYSGWAYQEFHMSIPDNLNLDLIFFIV